MIQDDVDVFRFLEKIEFGHNWALQFLRSLTQHHDCASEREHGQF
jgi:hypothetical protein